VIIPRCAEPDCLRPVWRGGRCWWCWMARAAREAARKSGLDSAAQPKAPLCPMTDEDVHEG